jgi:tRNA A-37 threonylcarbamoyl transferase component Bud32
METPEPTSVAELSRLLPGHYVLERLIGAGGMAEVYAAADTRHGRTVAVKVMRREVVRSLGPERFLREISIVAKLAHPNITPLYDSAQAGPLLYYVMPYVEGRSLRERIKNEGQLPPDDAVRIALETAEALAYAHAQGIVHRDIKPENILLEAGHALVTDFGVARAIEAAGSDRMTSAGMVLGTPAYMSPEQLNGSEVVDERADLYALALVLYEMLSGDLPFQSSSPGGMIARKTQGEYASLRVVRPSVSKALDQVIVRALAPVPADRFRSVDEFAAALRQASTPGVARLGRRALAGRLLLLGGAVALAALAVRLWLVPPAGGTGGLQRVVVAPLENRTGLASLDALGVMAADWITAGLQQTSLVEVVPTPTAIEAARYLAQKALAGRLREPMGEIARETGAATVVGGAYYQQGDRLLFRIDVADQGGRRLAGALTDITAPAADPMRGIEEARARLMGWLAERYDERLRASADRSGRPPTYRAYLAFSEAMTHYIAVENAAALPLFLNAFQADTSFTTALLYASLCLTNLGRWAPADSLLQQVDRRRGGMTEYDRAWLDYRLGLVHGNPEAALAAIRVAARLAPGSKAVFNYATQAFQAGHLDEALDAAESLPAEQGPMRGFLPYWDIFGAILHAKGNYDREYLAGTKARQLYPQRLTAYSPVARALVVQGRLDELASAVREAGALPTDPIGWDYGDLLLEVSEELEAHGQGAEARGYLERGRSWLDARDDPRSRARLVATLSALGQAEDAFALLRTLRRAEPGNVEWLGLTGLLYARTGRRDRANAVADTLAEIPPRYQFGVPFMYRARIAAALGDRETAVAQLREAMSRGAAYDLWLHRDHDLQSLRGYRPYELLLQGKR